MAKVRDDIEGMGESLWQLVVEGVPDVISTPQAAVLVVGEALVIGMDATSDIDVNALLDDVRARIAERKAGL